MSSWVDPTSAVGTAAAAAIALALGMRAEWRANKAERKAEALRQEQVDQGEHRQASRVASWVVDNSDDGSVHPPAGGDSTLHVQNASEEPVWKVVIFYRDTLEHPTEGTLYLMGEWDILAPGEKARRDVSIRLSQGRRTAQMWFRDNAGRDWQRDEEGTLSRRDPNYIPVPLEREHYLRTEDGEWIKTGEEYPQ